LKNTSNLDEQVVLYSNGNWEVKDENDNDNRYITSYNNKTYNYKIDDDNYYSIDNFNSSRNENVSNNKNKYNVVYNYRIIGIFYQLMITYINTTFIYIYT